MERSPRDFPEGTIFVVRAPLGARFRGNRLQISLHEVCCLYRPWDTVLLWAPCFFSCARRLERSQNVAHDREKTTAPDTEESATPCPLRSVASLLATGLLDAWSSRSTRPTRNPTTHEQYRAASPKRVDLPITPAESSFLLACQATPPNQIEL